MNQLTVAILAGGLGTRLRSVVNDRPKVLAEIGGKPFLAYLLDHLSSFGFGTVVLCTGYLGEQIAQRFGKRYGEMELFYSQEASPLGTAGALRLALPLLKSESALVVNGDSFCDADLRGFWQWHRGREADASMLLVEVPDTRRYGRVSVDNEGRVIRFEEKNEEGAPGWINAGIYLIRRRLLEKLPEKQNVSLERDVFPAFLKKGLFGFQSKARFLDIGTPQSYQSASRFFHEG